MRDYIQMAVNKAAADPEARTESLSDCSRQKGLPQDLIEMLTGYKQVASASIDACSPEQPARSMAACPLSLGRAARLPLDTACNVHDDWAYGLNPGMQASRLSLSGSSKGCYSRPHAHAHCTERHRSRGFATSRELGQPRFSASCQCGQCFGVAFCVRQETAMIACRCPRRRHRRARTAVRTRTTSWILSRQAEGPRAARGAGSRNRGLSL